MEELPKETLKAGCYLVDVPNRKVAIIYRQSKDDYTFPKGHLEEGETIEECAIRETAEEVKRVAKIVEGVSHIIERYTTPKGERCCTYMYVAQDVGHSDNDSLETHDLMWVDIDRVEDILSYDDLVVSWRKAKKIIVEKLL